MSNNTIPQRLYVVFDASMNSVEFSADLKRMLKSKRRIIDAYVGNHVRIVDIKLSSSEAESRGAPPLEVAHLVVAMTGDREADRLILDNFQGIRNNHLIFRY